MGARGGGALPPTVLEGREGPGDDLALPVFDPFNPPRARMEAPKSIGKRGTAAKLTGAAVVAGGAEVRVATGATGARADTMGARIAAEADGGGGGGGGGGAAGAAGLAAGTSLR